MTCECGTCPKCKRRAYMRDWYRRLGNAERQRAKQRRYNADHQDERGTRPVEVEKKRARNAIRHSERPSECPECGAPDQPCADGRSSIQAHHDDYSKPHDYRWLCKRCHGKVHRVVP